MTQDPRLSAVKIIHQVIVKGRSLDAALAQQTLSDARESALTREIAYGVIRQFFCLRHAADQLLNKPLKNKDQDVLMLILAGLYQLECMRIPAHAAVSETVAVTHGLRKPWARGLVNAVLRGFQRNRKALVSGIVKRPETITNHPSWLLRRLYHSWPKQFRSLVTANNLRAPMSLRVNLAHVSRDDYLSRLNEAGIPAAGDPHITCAITLAAPVNVQELPGFLDGDVSVQDKSAQQAALLLDVAPEMRVLDACAAPGGKTGHLLELVDGDVDLTALDVSGQRLARVRENLERPGYSATLIEGDATRPGDWWDGRLFDRILVDAPCSGTGVIRRHPDIKLHRKPSDISSLAELQFDILRSLWKLLAPGGKLLYCTCSVLTEENDEQLSRFVATGADATSLAVGASCALETRFGRQVITGTNGMDGFYYGCLQKNAP